MDDQNTIADAITATELNWVKNQGAYFAILDRFLDGELTPDEFYELKAALIAS